MAYSEDDVRFQKNLNSYPESLPKDKIVVGLRAWSEDKKYHYSKINNKINFIRSAGYQNIGLYSYLGLINNNYLPNLKF
jgi:biopolymer transport protein ExbD